MRLIDLDPHWLIDNGERVGFTFVCPTDSKWRQGCFDRPYPRREQWRLFKELYGIGFSVQGADPSFGWTIAGGLAAATFETMTVTPSLDGSPGGMWHGHITDGEIVGGI